VSHATIQRIEIGPSRILAIVLCLIHPGAGAAIWLAAVPLWLKVGLIITIIADCGWCLFSRAFLRPADAIVAVEISAAGKLSFLTRAGAWHAAELLGTTYVAAYLTILNLKPDGRRLARHVVLVADNVDPDDFRRLRTWLRWAPRPGAVDASATGMASP